MTALLEAPPGTMTADDLLALPDDGKERWLIRGRLRERPMTVRNRTHSRILMRVGYLLSAWIEQRPQPRGAVLGGEVGCRLRRDPDTVVGIDVVYVSPEMAAQEPEDTCLIDGPPTLAVEILSPNDVVQELHERIEELLNAGVAVVWIVNPYLHTVTVCRRGVPADSFNEAQQLPGGPELPGFSVSVAELFR